MQTDEHGFLASRTLPDGRLLAVYPLFFGTARLTVGYGYDTYDRAF